MRILIAGVDGYLGWSLANYLAGAGMKWAASTTFFAVAGSRRWEGGAPFRSHRCGPVLRPLPIGTIPT